MPSMSRLWRIQSVVLSAETEDGTFTPQDVSLTPDAVQKFEEFRQLSTGRSVR